MIPQGVITRCYSTNNCAGPINKEFTQLFVETTENVNFCCYVASQNARPNPDMLSFTLNGGGCRRCDGKATNKCHGHTIFKISFTIGHQ